MHFREFYLLRDEHLMIRSNLNGQEENDRRVMLRIKINSNIIISAVVLFIFRYVNSPWLIYWYNYIDLLTIDSFAISIFF